jgi:hypothetical protein
MIEDQSEGSFLGSMFGEKNDGFIKDTIAEGGVGKKELFMEFGRRRLRVHQKRMNVEKEKVKTSMRGFGNQTPNLGKVVEVILYYGLIIRPNLGSFAAHE